MGRGGAYHPIMEALWRAKKPHQAVWHPVSFFGMSFQSGDPSPALPYNGREPYIISRGDKHGVGTIHLPAFTVLSGFDFAAILAAFGCRTAEVGSVCRRKGTQAALSSFSFARARQNG